jgi:hypothetical protein
MVFQVNIPQVQVFHSSLLQSLMLLMERFIGNGWQHVGAIENWLDTEIL